MSTSSAMASNARGRYDPVFEPSSEPTYVDPAPRDSPITSVFEIEPQSSNNPDIQPFEYDPKQAISGKIASSSSLSPLVRQQQQQQQQRWRRRRRRRRSKWYDMLVVLGDAILSLLPLLFVILAFRALAVNGHPISSGGQAVVEAAKFGPTAFPIIFAAVVGRLMRSYAQWKAEKGARLGVLEQLVGSQNLFSSIERVFVLRNYTLLGFSILILWALSPVGSQSALRVISTTKASTPGSQVVYYFNTSIGGTHDSAFDGGDDMTTYGPSMEAIYRAALLAPQSVKSSSVDIWNNPKVPFLEQVRDFSYTSTESDDAAWLEVPNSTNTSYSSLTGITLANLPPEHTSNFSMETSYFYLDCTDPVFFSINQSSLANKTADPNRYYGGFLDWLGNIYFTPNKTDNVFGFTKNQSDTGAAEWSSFMVDTNWNFMHSNASQAPINLIYASQGASSPEAAAFNCTVGTTRVEANLICSGSTGADCRVGRMRQSLVDRTPNITTPFNCGDPVYMDNFITWFTFAAGVMHSATISPTDSYLAGSNEPYAPMMEVSFGSDSSPYRGIGGKEFSLRFSRLINTAWQVSLATASIAQSSSENLTTLAQNSGSYNTANTTADTILLTEVYAVNAVWLTLTLVISFILLACGIAGMVFKYRTRGPDLLGYVSTMTRDNPYFVHGAGNEEEEEDAPAPAGSGLGSGLGSGYSWDSRSNIGSICSTDSANRGSSSTNRSSSSMMLLLQKQKRSKRYHHQSQLSTATTIAPEQDEQSQRNEGNEQSMSNNGNDKNNNNTFRRLDGLDRLDGLERARVFRNTRVQVTNVKPWTENGYIALRKVGT